MESLSTPDSGFRPARELHSDKQEVEWRPGAVKLFAQVAQLVSDGIWRAHIPLPGSGIAP